MKTAVTEGSFPLNISSFPYLAVRGKGTSPPSDLDSGITLGLMQANALGLQDGEYPTEVATGCVWSLSFHGEKKYVRSKEKNRFFTTFILRQSIMNRAKTREILLQCIGISKHHVVHFKYLTVLFVNYTSIKMQHKKGNKVVRDSRARHILECHSCHVQIHLL